MKLDPIVERLFEALITGDRHAARAAAAYAEKAAGGPTGLITHVLWPTQQLMDKLYRADQLSRISHHMGVRLLRVIADQTAGRLVRQPSNGKQVLCFCGPSETEELGAQLAVDVLEAAGFNVFFAGAGVAYDEILGRVHEDQPAALVMFCSAPQDLPDIRQLIDTIREIGASKQTLVAVGGGVFNRAEGLAEEIGADLWGKTPMEMIEALIEGMEPDQAPLPEVRPAAVETRPAATSDAEVVTAIKRTRKRKAA
jgi:MerR family transcriptional regulator, light-induced transcriptional regulator